MIDDRVKNTARLITRKWALNDADREDAVQEALIRYWQSWESRPDLDDENRRKYSNGAMRRGVVNFLVRQSYTGHEGRNGKPVCPLRRPETLEHWDACVSDESGNDTTWWDIYEAGTPDIADGVVAGHVVDEAISTLPDWLRQLAVRWRAGYTPADMAEELNKPVASVRAGMTQARRRMREYIGEG